MLKIQIYFSTCGDITYWDKTSIGKKIWRNKTSRETKSPEGQNVQRDKTSVRQNVRQTKPPGGQNIRRHNISGTKRPWGQNVRRQHVRLGHIFKVHCRQYIFTEKPLEPGGKIR
jgi:hypothetical protein